MARLGLRQHLCIQILVITVHLGGGVEHQRQAITEADLRLVRAEDRERPQLREQALTTIQAVDNLDGLR